MVYGIDCCELFSFGLCHSENIFTFSETYLYARFIVAIVPLFDGITKTIRELFGVADASSC